MRASSLSQPRVIEILSRYFIPIWMPSDEAGLSARGKTEAEEHARVQRLARERGLQTGMVYVYLLDAQGTPTDTMVVSRAAKPENLLPLLEKVVNRAPLQPRSTPLVVRPRTPATQTKSDKLRLHIRTQQLGSNAHLGPTDDWVELTPAETAKFLPPSEARVGSTWSVPREVADKIYSNCFPIVPHYQVSDSKIAQASLTATVTEIGPATTQIRLRGSLKMKHDPAGKESDGWVTATLLGFVEVDAGRRTASNLQLVSEEANLIWHWKGEPIPARFQIAVQNAP
jgi:hypothetical protein